MIDANALIALPGTCLIIPECVESGRIRRCAQCIGQPQVQQSAKPRPGFGQNQSVADPGLRIMDVPVVWNDILIAGENQWFFVGQ